MDIASDHLEQETGSFAIRPIDRAVLEMLRREPGLSIPQLIERFHVTATAVRQRVDRLVEFRLIERRKVSVGRGRPSFQHFLTPLGWREVGATYADLAMAMWQEVSQLPNSLAKEKFLERVSQRMGKAYGDEIPPGPLRERMDALVRLLADRKIPARVEEEGLLPILEVHTCPYPDLNQGGPDRQMCELEKRVITEALGEVVELSRCRLDGHHCCQFRPTGIEENAVGVPK